MKKTAFLIFLFMAIETQALTTVSADFSGSIQVELMNEEHFRHSLDCYRDGKGKQTHLIGTKTLILEGGHKRGNLGVHKWSSSITSPFPRKIRDVVLTTNLKNDGINDKIEIKLEDIYGFSDAQYKSSQCGHTDGLARPFQAQIEGRIRIHYTVPENVWALRIERQGQGLLHNMNMKSIEGVLNAGYDKTISSSEIFWVKPGSQITQEISFPEAVPGNNNIGRAEIHFKPVTAVMSQANSAKDRISFLKKHSLEGLKNSSIQNDNEKSIDFINSAMSILLYPAQFSSILEKLPTQDLINLSNDLFTTANEIYPSAHLGLPLKTAAALASYEVSMKLLNDLSAYCDIVDVHLPFKNKNIQVFGLRAAGFWLTRGLSSLKNYRFTEYQAFVDQLVALEFAGTTYADVNNDPKTMKQIQDAYDFLTETIDVGGSPFKIALKDVQRTLKKFGSISSSNEDTEHLISSLKEMDKLESKFVRSFFESLDSFTEKSPNVVQGKIFDQQLNHIRKMQNLLSNDMSRTIRLLSIEGNEDSNSVMNVMLGLLSHQVAIFEKPLNDVPYFENIRREYFTNKDRMKTIKKVQNCVLGGM